MVAELGKVKNVTVDQLEAGMKVHRDVLGRGGKVLVGAGEILSRKHVTQLRKWEAREKPQGPALPKKNIKDRLERVQHGEFEGGWRPSHFNPKGIMVSASTASGDEVPEVDRNPEASPAYQKLVSGSKASVAFDAGAEENSPIYRRMRLNEEIKALELFNAQLGGKASTIPHEQRDLTEAGMTTYRDSLKEENEAIVADLKASKNGNRNGHDDDTDETPAKQRPAAKGRRSSRR